MGYVPCSGCGDPTMGPANESNQTFCAYCVELAEDCGIDLTQAVSQHNLDTLATIGEDDVLEAYA
jgi:hypothetical protein